jgi:hypothetical protein
MIFLLLQSSFIGYLYFRLYHEEKKINNAFNKIIDLVETHDKILKELCKINNKTINMTKLNYE